MPEKHQLGIRTHAIIFQEVLRALCNCPKIHVNATTVTASDETVTALDLAYKSGKYWRVEEILCSVGGSSHICYMRINSLSSKLTLLSNTSFP